jgi:hypothetical protein
MADVPLSAFELTRALAERFGAITSMSRMSWSDAHFKAEFASAESARAAANASKQTSSGIVLHFPGRHPIEVKIALQACSGQF